MQNNKNSKQTTLAIIKPDSMAGKNAGKILAHLESAGFDIIGAKVLHLDEDRAGLFYEEHRGKEFYGPLIEFMTSGPVMVLALAGEEAVAGLRRIIGATDPADAGPGTVRKLYAESKRRNAIHASDSEASARRELAFFFSPDELIAGGPE
ncbi:MAG: nucleoside-diphosphate kinase [Gemmatimonadota bacterium]|nr:nucleoside-diphosphate kinase [Gemmatimonadota bacterium]